MPRASARRSSSAARSPACQLAGGLPDPGRVIGDRVQQAQLDPQRDELLLGAVVQVPLDPLPLGVLGLDQPSPGRPQVVDRGAQLGGQPRVAQHQPGLRSELGQQLVLGRGDGLVPGLEHGQRSQQLAGVPHRDRPAGRPRSGSPPEPGPPAAAAAPARPGLRPPGARSPAGAVRRQPGPTPRPAPRRWPRPGPRPSGPGPGRGRAGRPCPRRSRPGPDRARPARRRPGGWRSAGRAGGPAGTAGPPPPRRLPTAPDRRRCSQPACRCRSRSPRRPRSAPRIAARTAPPG